MLLLALLSAVGTIIPQEHLAQPERGTTLEQMYTERFGAETTYELKLGNGTLSFPTSKLALIKTLGLTRVYFTWYFFGLLLWLSVSAVICNIVRCNRTVKLWRSPQVVRREASFKADKRAIHVEGTGPDAAERLSAELAARKFRLHRVDKDGVACFYADRGFTQRWAMVLLHFAFIVLLFGGIYGRTFGVEDSVLLADGERKVLTLDLLKGKIPLVRPLLERVPEFSFNLAQDNFHIDYDQHLNMPRGVIENVPEELHEYHRYFVKDYVSDFTVERNGRSVTKEVKVNHPIKLDKLVLYQSSYIQQGYLAVTIDGGTEEHFFPPNEWLVLTPGGLAFADAAASATSRHAILLEQVKAGDLYVRGKKERYIGPMTIAYVQDMSSSGPPQSMIISPDEGFETIVGGKIAQVRLSERVDNSSIFSYKRDPGIPMLYLGWISMIIGVTLALYIPFFQVWARVEGGSAHLLVLGPAGHVQRIRRRLRDILC